MYTLSTTTRQWTVNTFDEAVRTVAKNANVVVVRGADEQGPVLHDVEEIEGWSFDQLTEVELLTLYRITRGKGYQIVTIE